MSTQSLAAKKLITAIKAVESLRDTTALIEDISQLPSTALYSLKSVAETSLKMCKEREEKERQKEEERQELIRREDEEAFMAMRSFSSYKHLSDSAIRDLIRKMRQAAEKSSLGPSKSRKTRTKKKVAQETSSQNKGAIQQGEVDGSANSQLISNVNYYNS